MSCCARRHRLLRTLDVVPLSPLGNVLEVGCGAGFSARYLKGRYSSYTGVDYARNLIMYAQRMNNLPQAAFHAVDVSSFSPKIRYNMIFMIGVLHHFTGLEAVFKHILSLAAPGGWVVANEPQSSNCVIQGARSIRACLDRSYSSEQAQFSPAAIRRLFCDAGLLDVRVKPQGLFSTPFAEMRLRPIWALLPLVRCLNQIDRILENAMAKSLLAVSWNVVVAGRVPG